jgi:hypothetical protein
VLKCYCKKKEKEKLQLCVSMGRNSLQQKTLPILQTKNLLRKIKTEETYMKEQTEESHRQRPYFSQRIGAAKRSCQDGKFSGFYTAAAKELWRRRRSCKSRKTVTTTTIAAEELYHLSKPWDKQKRKNTHKTTTKRPEEKQKSMEEIATNTFSEQQELQTGL